MAQQAQVEQQKKQQEKTNAIYEGVPAYLREFTVSERDMTKYIIGTMSGIDRPMTPAAKGNANPAISLSTLISFLFFAKVVIIFITLHGYARNRN